MTQPGCPALDDLRQFALGRGDARTFESIAAHLATECSVCRSVLERLTQEVAADEDAAALKRLWKAGEARDSAVEKTVSLPSDDTQSGTPAPAPVARIGDYEVRSEIARGGMGVVYRAWHRRLGREVALKMILPERRPGPEVLERFYREARAAAQLQHPGIVPVFEVGEDAGRPFLAMAFVAGQSLRDYAHDAPLAPREAATLVRDIAEALHYAHERGIIHRDVKPQNVLLDQQGRPLVTDFGLAKIVGADNELTVAGQILGTPSYMAPEQAAGSGRVDARTDVYAAGATLYFLLTNRPPFQAASAAETLHQVLAHDPVPPRRLNPAVPRDLETICLTSLHKEPGRRYPRAADLAADLSRWLDHQPIRARPPRRFERLWLWGRRRPAVAALLVVLLVVLLLGAGTFVEFRARFLATAQVERLLTAELEELPALIRELAPRRERVDPQLRSAFAAAARDDDADRQLRAALALLPTDDSPAPYLRTRLLTAEPRTFRVVSAAFDARRETLLEPLLATAQDRSAPVGERFRATVALAAHFAPDSRWHAHRRLLVDQLVAVLPSEVATWRDLLAPARDYLIADLLAVFRSAERSEAERWVALDVLAAYAAERPETVLEMLARADVRQFAALWPRVTAPRDDLIRQAAAGLHVPPGDLSDVEAKQHGKQQANLSAVLLLLNRPDAVWEALRMPAHRRLRAYFAHTAARLEVPAGLLVDRLSATPRPDEHRLRSTLLLALGEYEPERIPADSRATLATALLAEFERAADPGERSAAEWLLRRWDHGERLAVLEDGLRQPRPDTGRLVAEGRPWFVNSQGQTLVVLRAGTFGMGSRETDTFRGDHAARHQRRLDRTFAIGLKEVTNAQFARFADGNPDVFVINPAFRESALETFRTISPTPQCPQMALYWYEAAAYCNWLSEQEGVPRDEWCYVPNADGKYGDGMACAENWLVRTGYRLPSEAEWEFACRAGSESCHYFGTDSTLLDHYAWHAGNAQGRTRPGGLLKPNDFGLFDILGNVSEWCGNRFDPYPAGDGVAADESVVVPVHDNVQMTARGGGWHASPGETHCASRFFPIARVRFTALGFRIARTLKGP